MIPVSKPFLPPIEEYEKYLKGIWERNWITNHGPLVTELEEKLRDYLGVKHAFFVSNGTIALQLAIRALDLKKEIITTPFSYVATTSSIVWENCIPVFVDIDNDTLCIDPGKIEAAITKDTQAILATHVYGNVCDVEKIKDIADKNGLKVIYDGAHSFGIKYKERSIHDWADITTLSFHATKLFHTGEGGAVITNDDEVADKIFYLRNFGHKGQDAYWGLGINGKNSELHAAMGLCVLPQIEEIINKRKHLSSCYDKCLFDSGVELRRPKIREGTAYNYGYYPVIFRSEELLLKTKAVLEENGIFPRRYFYPILTDLNYVNKKSVPIAEGISSKILCLPLYYDLKEEEIELICGLIKSSAKFNK